MRDSRMGLPDTEAETRLPLSGLPVAEGKIRVPRGGLSVAEGDRLLFQDNL